MLRLSQKISKKRKKRNKSESIYNKKEETKETCDQHAKRGLSSTLVGASCFHFFHIVPFFCIFFFLFSNLDLCYFSFGLLFGLHHYISAHYLYILSPPSSTKKHRELLHHSLWYNHSSTTDCSPSSCPFQEEKELVQQVVRE